MSLINIRRLRSLLKDDMLNVLLNVSINGPSLAAADGVIQEATKVDRNTDLFIPSVLYQSLFIIFVSNHIFCLSLQTWLTDKSRYKLKNASQARQVLKGKEELPVVFYSAGTQTEEAGLNLEAEMEEAKKAKEEEERANYATVAESLDLGEDNTVCNTDDEDSGLDSVSEDDF